MTISTERVRTLVGGRGVSEYDLETEMELLRRLDDLLDTADVFWDIGAHAGLYGVVATQLHPELDIYAFEASAVTRERILEDSVAGLDGVTVVPYALADEPGEVPFLESGVGQTTNSLASTTVAPDDHDPVEVVAHSARSAVDELGLPAPDAVKLDVEGAEHRVLRGFDRELLDGLELLLVEMHHIDTEDTDTVSFLEESGFEVTRLVEREIDDDRRTEHVRADPA